MRPLGDINGDGLQDFSIGTEIHFGSKDFELTGFHGEHTSTTVSAWISANSRRQIYTTSLVALGDTNGDGLDDLGVNGWSFDERWERAARRATVLGRSDLAESNLFIHSREWVDGSFPNSSATSESTILPTTGYFLQSDGSAIQLAQRDAKVFNVGDINLDGRQDHLVFLQDRDRTAHILFGADQLSQQVDVTTYPKVELPRFHSEPMVASPEFDFNGDHAADVVIAGDGESDYFIISSDANLSTIGSIAAEPIPNLYGHIMPGGDFNDDGKQDLVVGGYYATTILFPSESVSEPRMLTIPAVSPNPDVDHASSLVLDVNGDGVDDLLFGDPAHPPRSDFGTGGRVQLLLGRPSTNAAGQGTPIGEFGIAPGEQLTLRITGIATDRLLTSDLAFELVPPAGHHEMDPRNNKISIHHADRLFGDLDNNGAIDFADFLILSSNFGNNDASSHDGDLNADRRVDFSDFLLFARQFLLKPLSSIEAN